MRCDQLDRCIVPYVRCHENHHQSRIEWDAPFSYATKSLWNELDIVNFKRERTLLLVIRDETDTYDIAQLTKVHYITSGLTDNVLLELAEVQRDFFPFVDALR